MEAQIKKKHRSSNAPSLRESVTQAIREATIQEICRDGVGRLSVDAVAARAGVGKAAIYRRWPTKEKMLEAALIDSGLKIASSPDTGSLDGDVEYYITKAAEILTDPILARLLPHLYAEVATASPLGNTIRTALHKAKRKSIKEIVDRAIKREELPQNYNADFALSILAGPVYWHLMIMQNKIDKPYLKQFKNFVMAGLQAEQKA